MQPSEAELWWMEQRRLDEARYAAEAAAAEALAIQTAEEATNAAAWHVAVATDHAAAASDARAGRTEVDMTYTEGAHEYDMVELAFDQWSVLDVGHDVGSALSAIVAVTVDELELDDAPDDTAFEESLRLQWRAAWAFSASSEPWFPLSGPGDSGVRVNQVGDYSAVRLHGPFGSRLLVACRLLCTDQRGEVTDYGRGLDGVARRLRVDLAVQWRAAAPDRSQGLKRHEQPPVPRYTLKPHREALDATQKHSAEVLASSKFACPNRSCSNYGNALPSVRCPVCRHYSRT